MITHYWKLSKNILRKAEFLGEKLVIRIFLEKNAILDAVKKIHQKN